MTWTDAVIEVLAEEGRAMHYKDEITKIILDRGYKTTFGKTPDRTVSRTLTTNPNLFRRVSKSEYELIDSTIVGRPCTLGGSKYKCVSSFVDPEELENLFEQEKDLLELIVNVRLPLASGEVCFADILDKLEVQFLEEEGNRTQLIDAVHLEKKLGKLNRQIANVKQNPQHRNSNGDLLEQMLSVAEHAQQLLNKAKDGKVKIPYTILGEFIPGSKPKVVIYLKSICSLDRWKVMAGVFVHEMFHAWNYFNAGERSVLSIDEPMVEFETLYFLQELEAFTRLNALPQHDNVRGVKSERELRVKNKQQSIGNVAAYGFGYYLFEELSKRVSKIWIETYSKKSASIKNCDPSVEKVEKALIPIYPFQSERQVMNLFKKIIL